MHDNVLLALIGSVSAIAGVLSVILGFYVWAVKAHVNHIEDRLTKTEKKLEETRNDLDKSREENLNLRLTVNTVVNYSRSIWKKLKQIASMLREEHPISSDLIDELENYKSIDEILRDLDQ